MALYNGNTPTDLVEAGDVHAPATDTDAVVTYAAVEGKCHVLSGVAWSYDATPTGGNLKIENGSGTTVFTVDITNAGAGFFPFPIPKRGSTNTALIITLAAAGVVGKLSILNHWTE